MSEKLKPCPFCGGEAKLVDVGIEGEFQDWRLNVRIVILLCYTMMMVVYRQY